MPLTHHMPGDSGWKGRVQPSFGARTHTVSLSKAALGPETRGEGASSLAPVFAEQAEGSPPSHPAGIMPPVLARTGKSP